jgi:competence protein ComGC
VIQRRAFTVVELLVAVVVLLAVIIATSKIFSTASKVSSTGEATADVLQQGSVLEEQMRRDLDRITRDGYMAIQCVAVRNDVNRVVAGANAPLLNPDLPANAVLRCDQVVFFTAGTEVSARWAGPGDLVTSGGGQQARATRVYYGHGVQFPGLGNDPLGSGSVQTKPVITGVNPAPSGPRQITPWTWYDPTTFALGWQWGTTSNTSANAPRVSANQPEARQWVLARKAVLLADDGGRTLYYPEPASLTVAQSQGPSSAPSVFGDRSNTAGVGGSGSDSTSLYQEFRDRNWVPGSSNLIPSPMLQAGWVDVAASDLDKLRRAIAPTLRLQNPTFLPPGPPNGVAIESVSTPFSALVNTNIPPSWPAGGSAPTWPSGTTIVGTNFAGGTVNNYSNQRDRIMRGTFGLPANGTVSSVAPFFGLLGWPRAEKAVPNTDRRSEILTSPVLLTNCSSFQVDWTWEPGTGKQLDSTGALLVATDVLQINNPTSVGYGGLFTMRGFEPGANGNWAPAASGPPLLARTQPWFGFPDTGDGSGAGAVVPLPADRLGVTLAQDNSAMPIFQQNGSGGINATNTHMRRVAQLIEGVQGNAVCPPITAPFGAGIPVRVYTAVFGFNQDDAYLVTPDGIRVLREDFTPFPTQIRVTCTVHDPRLVLDRGRQFQFVLDVPKRRQQ